MPIQFNRIDQKSLYVEIVQRVRHAIVFGELEFGEHLSEPSIAAQMEVSRIPLREALVILTKEEIITRDPGRGFFVISLSPQDIIEVFSLRSMLDCMALAQSIPNLTSCDFECLDKLVVQQEIAYKTQQYDLVTQLDMRFHEYFCQKANHKRLLNTWRTYEMQCQMLIHRRFRLFLNVTPETVKEDHIRLIHAAHQRDVLLAMEITRSISDRVSRECIQMVQDCQSVGGEVSPRKNQRRKSAISTGARSVKNEPATNVLSKE